MDDAKFQEYLEKRYEDQMKYYDRKAADNQKKYKQWTLIVIVLSALTPVLAAISFANWPMLTDILKVTLVLISAIVAIGTTILKTFRYQELWTTYRETGERLRSEKYLYDARIGVYSQKDLDTQALFVDQVESILSKEHSKWTSTNQSLPGSQSQQKENDNQGNSDMKPVS
ncbi:MAG TPA: DUF4231 domain-containing protein [Chitinophagales bacterium]|nr:DUF4231 domain-containing protein [Chitinophagales bacterium]